MERRGLRSLFDPGHLRGRSKLPREGGAGRFWNLL